LNSLCILQSLSLRPIASIRLLRHHHRLQNKFTMSSTIPRVSLQTFRPFDLDLSTTDTHTHSTSALNPSSMAQRSVRCALHVGDRKRCARLYVYVPRARGRCHRVACVVQTRGAYPGARKKLILLASRRWPSTRSGWLTVSAIVATSITGA